MFAVGPHAMWGFSPAFDLRDLLREGPAQSADEPGADEPAEKAILVVQPGDVRHVLHTIAQRALEAAENEAALDPLHIVIFDAPVEVVARHLLLLHLAFDWDIPIRHRANLFLEVFGNCLVQERTARYISKAGRELVDLLCNESGPLAELVDFRLLKFRERDMLESCFKAWDHRVPFDIVSMRDRRLRHHFAERFDSRKSVVDWDYQSGVKLVAGIIHSRQYQDWRQNGIAYEFGDQNYVDPNRTMATYTEGTMKAGRDRGLKKEILGFWLDIVVSPFMALGLSTDQPNAFAHGLMEVVNRGTGVEQHRHHAVEVAVHSVISYLWAIETGTRYTMRQAHEVYSGLGTESIDQGTRRPAADDGADGVKPVPNEDDAETAEGAAEEKSAARDNSSDGAGEAPDAVAESTADQQQASQSAVVLSERQQSRAAHEALRRAERIMQAMSGIKVSFASGELENVLRKSSMAQRFDACFLSCAGSHHIASANVARSLKPGAQVAVEGPTFIPTLQRKQRREFQVKLRDMAQENHFVPSSTHPPAAVDAYTAEQVSAGELATEDVLPVCGGATEPDRRYYAHPNFLHVFEQQQEEQSQTEASASEPAAPTAAVEGSGST